MKFLYSLFMLALVSLAPLGAQAQMGTSCLGCMPRTGQVYDSTMTTPAPSFTTSASTGDVYIPPREVIITVPVAVPSPPAPAANDPNSFSSTMFTCSAGGIGNDGAKAAALTLYKNIGGRCADTEGLQFWATVLVNCIAANPDYGWGVANSQGQSFYEGKLGDCGITSGITGNVNTSDDQASMSNICVQDASTRGFISPNSYSYSRGPSSSTCTK